MEILLVLVFSMVFALAMALFSTGSGRTVRKRLARMSDGSQVSVEVSDGNGLLDNAKPGFWTRLLSPLAGRAAPRSQESLGPIRLRLVQAGFRREQATTVYMGSRVALAITFPMVALAMSPAWDVTQVQLLAIVTAAAGLGLVAPSYFVDRVRKVRQRDLVLGLPDALDMMVVCVEAGLGVNAALARVAGEFHRTNATLSTEFELVNLEARAGKTTTDALRSLAERTGVTEISSLVAMLVQTERFGTSLADTLRVHADAMRSQRMLRAEEQAGKAPLKMLFPTLIIFIATLIVTIGPGMIEMFSFFAEQQ